MSDEYRENLIRLIEKGRNLPQNKTILHTSPHHDDIMLAYYPILKDLIAHNKNIFACFTSGYNSVTDNFITKTLNFISDSDLPKYFSPIFEKENRTLLLEFVEAFNDGQIEKMQTIESLICLRNFSRIYGLKNLEEIKHLRKSAPITSLFKGSMRESEEERMFATLSVFDNILHLRARFYDGVEDLSSDIHSFSRVLEKVNPNIITVAIDPQGTGPKTHYRSLQVVLEALKLTKPNFQPTIWGYRNVWSQFTLQETDLFFPVKERELEEMHKTFMGCYTTQKVASFPNPNFSGPFSMLSQQIMRDQYQQVVQVFGNKEIRDAAAFIFMKTFSKSQFLEKFYLE